MNARVHFLPTKVGSLAVWLCILFGTATLQASIVYDNEAGGAAGINGGTLSDDRSPAYVADDVTLNETLDITGIEWTGMFLFGDDVPPARDQFTVAIFPDSAGAPAGGAPLAQFPVGNAANRSDSGIDFNGSDIYDFSAKIALTMNAGVTYWVSIYNDTEPDDDLYYWGMLNDQGNSFFSGDGGASWSSFADRHDFRLLGVPEPLMPSMFSGVTLLLLRRRGAALRRDLKREPTHACLVRCHGVPPPQQAIGVSMPYRDAVLADGPAISEFVSALASDYIAPACHKHGVAKLLESMNPAATAERLAAGWPHFGCWDEQGLAGIVVVKPVDHLYHLFVRSDLQGQGMGRTLFTMADDRVFSETATRLATVNSSLNAVDVYRRLGFEPSAGVKNVDGVRFQPMSRVERGPGSPRPGS